MNAHIKNKKNILFFIIFFLIIFKFFNTPYNAYSLILWDYDKRMTQAYGFCKNESWGFYNYVISKSQTACCRYFQWNLITSNSEGTGPPETIFHFIMFCPLFVNLCYTLLRNINYLLDSHHGQIINTIVDKTNVQYAPNCISSNEFMAAFSISRMTIILGKHLSDLVLEKSIDSIAKRFIRKAWKKRKHFIHSLELSS